MINIYRTGTYYCKEANTEFDPCTCTELFNYHDLDFLFYDREKQIVWLPVVNEGIAEIPDADDIKQFFDDVTTATQNCYEEISDYLKYELRIGNKKAAEEYAEELKILDHEFEEIEEKRNEILTKYFHKD